MNVKEDTVEAHVVSLMNDSHTCHISLRSLDSLSCDDSVVGKLTTTLMKQVFFCPVPLFTLSSLSLHPSNGSALLYQPRFVFAS